jgi:hypothetical protein
MWYVLDNLFTVSGAVTAAILVIVAIIIWRHRKLD